MLREVKVNLIQKDHLIVAAWANFPQTLLSVPSPLIKETSLYNRHRPYRKAQAIHVQSCAAQPQGTSTVHSYQGPVNTGRERGQEGSKSQRIRMRTAMNLPKWTVLTREEHTNCPVPQSAQKNIGRSSIY